MPILPVHDLEIVLHGLQESPYMRDTVVAFLLNRVQHM